MMPIISIIIVSYNSEKYIASCLDSILAQDFKDYEVIVIDNASEDKTASFIKSRYPDCLLIENRANYGVCRARNQGIGIARGEFILCLDHDVLLEANFIGVSYQAIKGKSCVGAIAPKILLADRDTIYSAGIHNSFLRRFYDIGRGRKNDKEFDRQRYGFGYWKPNHCSLTYVFGASAAAALYRRRALEEIKVGGEYFDQEFFYFFEDVDLSWRMQNKGWKILYCPQAVCFHQAGRSRKKDRISQFFCFRNRYWMLIKNESFLGFLRFAALFFIYDLWRNLAMLATNPAYFIKASREIIKFLPKMARKRRY